MSRTRATAIALASAQASDGSALTAKLVTEEELYSAERATGSVAGIPLHLPANRAIWAVLVQGLYTPTFGNDYGKHLRWGVFEVDARTGAILGSFGGTSSTPWPGWKLLTDQANGS
ncbi:MAG: hypothetical protein ACLPVY_14065 [Acidimicrobiia bacterium]